MNHVTIPPLMEVSRLGIVSAVPDFKPAGESLGVWRTPNFPGYLFKRYNADASKKVNNKTLDRLVQQPHVLPNPTEAAFLATSTSWPVSRIIESQRTVGVMMPEAPPTMSVSWLRKSFTNPTTEHSPLPIDYLAKDDDWLAVRKIPRQSAGDRDALSRSLVRVACFFEQCGLVYADWSYANAFWQPYEHTVYIFDLDGSSYGPRAHVFTSEFEDPLTPDPQPVDNYTDRYRVALLVGRILTKSRSQPEVKVALGRMAGPVPQTLLRMLISAGDRTSRPSLTDLAGRMGVQVAQIQPVDPTGVDGWRGRNGHTPTNRPSAPAPSPASPGWRPRKDYSGGRTIPPQPARKVPATGSFPVIPPTPKPAAASARMPAPPPATPPPPKPTFKPAPQSATNSARIPVPPQPSTPTPPPAAVAPDADWAMALFGLLVIGGVIAVIVLCVSYVF